MTLKLLDVEYLRFQNRPSGQVLIVGSNHNVFATSTLVVVNNQVGINTVPSTALSVAGNVSLFGTSNGVRFPDGSFQNTSATSAVPPGGTSGAVQFNSNGAFGGDTANLYWDATTKRLGVGTQTPRSTFQIIDVGYESTNTSTSGVSAVILDSFPVPYYRSCHYIVQITDENFSYYQTSQVMVIQDGLHAFQTEYNIVVNNGKMGEITSQIQGGNVVLLFTPFYTSDKNIKVIRTSIEP